MKIDPRKIAKEVALADGDRVVILNVLENPKAFSKELAHRNLFRLGENNAVVWQVADYQPMSNSTFTNLYWKEDVLRAYNFDGIEYCVDLATGTVTPSRLLK